MRHLRWVTGLMLGLLLVAPFGLTPVFAAQSDGGNVSVTLIRDTPTPGPSPTATTTTPATSTSPPTADPTLVPTATATAEPVTHLPVTGSGTPDDRLAVNGILLITLLAGLGIAFVAAVTRRLRSS